jgi:hypothetical protein
MSVITRNDGPAGRFYQVGDRLLPSVTHILSVGVNKPALVPWAARVEREAVTEAAAALYEDLLKTRQAHPRAWYLAELHARLGQVKAHQKLLAQGGDLGSEIHKIVEWTIRTAIGAVAGPRPVVQAAALLGLAAFEQWAASVRLKPLLTERTVFSLTHGYAGTMDLLARVNGVVTVCELKSSKQIYPENMLQACAYRVAMEEMGYAPQASLIIRLPKTAADSFEVQPVPPVAVLFPVFLAAKQLWQWQQGNDAAWRKRPRTAVA